jgi:hypothetical protein
VGRLRIAKMRDRKRFRAAFRANRRLSRAPLHDPARLRPRRVFPPARRCVVGAANRVDARRCLAALWNNLILETPLFWPVLLLLRADNDGEGGLWDEGRRRGISFRAVFCQRFGDGLAVSLITIHAAKHSPPTPLTTMGFDVINVVRGYGPTLNRTFSALGFLGEPVPSDRFPNR